MSKSSQRRRKGGAGKSGRSSLASTSLSLSAFRAERQVDALTPAFVQWFDDGSPGAAVAALECMVPVKDVLGRYLESTAAAEITGFEPIPLVEAISAGISAAAGESSAESAKLEDAAFLLDAFRAYVEFLSETGRWSGSAEQLAGVRDFFDVIAEGDDGPQYLDVPEVPEEEALAVFSELPLIQRATALLRWIGNGKPVTGTGLLRLRDLEAAAACVGVAVRGGTKRVHSVDSVPTVRSMTEVPLLTQMWAAMEAAELIELKSTKVVPFEDSENFLMGDTSDRLGEFQMFTSCFLEQAVLGFDPDSPWERLVAGLQASLLMAAATPDPPSLERFLATADHAPEAERAMAGILASMALDRLEALAELGLLTIDTHFRVPPALVGCVADVFDNLQALAHLGLGEVPDDDDVLEEVHVQPPLAEPAGPETAVAAPRSATGSVLQLKILLKGSKPPIWRRVLVPADLPLSQLHRVIQGVFAWQDYHLHHFQTGGFRGPTYAPVDPNGEEDFYGEPSQDESKVTVRDLLSAVGSSMTYTYDFGDNWEHSITVEKVLSSDDGGQLPRCTAGRGAAPAEDSGGIWGWMDIVQAVNDPSHEEHKEYREWLGLGRGDTLDPKAFDLQQANEELADLF